MKTTSMTAAVPHQDGPLAVRERSGPDVEARAAEQQLRAAIRAERRTRSGEERRQAERGLRDVFLDLPQLRRAARVALYVSLRDEPGTLLLRAALAARGVDVVIPVVADSGELHWLPDDVTPAGMRDLRCRGWRRGSVRRAEDVEILLVPALAVDTRGRWLGRENDGYDGILRRLGPTSLVLGVAHDREVLDAAVEAVPVGPHDVPVDAVLTPTRVLFLPGRRTWPGHAASAPSGPARFAGRPIGGRRRRAIPGAAPSPVGPGPAPRAVPGPT